MNLFDPDMDLPEPRRDPADDSRAGAGRAKLPEKLEIVSGSGYPEDAAKMIGRYQVEYLIGRGGMGEVYKARDPETGRAVALKVLDISGYDDPSTLRRFRREADSALVLDHPNVAKFYGVEQDDAGHPVIVMEYIAGRGLNQVMDESSSLPYSQVLDYIIQTARGLENAYRRSIIHRDIKPENLIVTDENQVKIIDFGLAKSLWENSNLTGTGLVVGTPRYISPEQGMGRSVDQRSDIYSLGATLYELVTGQSPFDGDTPLAIMMKHINSPLTPPYMVNPRVPADISDIILKMMAKDPSARYQEYEPLIRDLESAKIHRLAKERRVAGDGSDMHTVVLPDGEDADSATGTRGSYLTEGLVTVDNTHPADEPPSRAKLVLLSLTGLAVLAFGMLFFSSPVYTDSGDSSTLGQNISRIFRQAKNRVAPGQSALDAADQDRERIDLTRARMEAVVSRLLQLRSTGEVSGTPRITALRDNQVFNVKQTQDAWGNDFYITDSAGKAMLVAPGRDGYDGTEDDFRLSLDGSVQVIPRPLQRNFNK